MSPREFPKCVLRSLRGFLKKRYCRLGVWEGCFWILELKLKIKLQELKIMGHIDFKLARGGDTVENE